MLAELLTSTFTTSWLLKALFVVYWRYQALHLAAGIGWGKAFRRIQIIFYSHSGRSLVLGRFGPVRLDVQMVV